MISDLTSSDLKKIIDLTQLVIKTKANVKINKETKRFFEAAIDLLIRYSLRN